MEAAIQTRVELNNYTHKPGGSCMVTALSGIYRYKGLNYSPEQIIGLGSGLQFAYGYDPEQKNYRIEFISSQLLYSLLCNTGTFGEEFEIVDNGEALSRMLDLLDEGMPVPVMLDPLYCEGLMKRTPKEFVAYIPSHMVVAVGYDLEERKVFLYDSPQLDLMTMDLDDFTTARCSGPTLPANRHIEFYFPDTLYPYAQSVKLAIGKVVQVFKYSEKHLAHKSGIEAIRRFAANVQNWRNIFTDEEIAGNARLFIMAVTNGHATKGAFRTQYSTFLREASALIGGDGYHASADAYQYLGRLWMEFQKQMLLLIRNPGAREVWKEDSDFHQLLDEIRDKEIAAIDLLEKELLKN
ncbi:MAG: DUF4872 domain-containing protein [Chitinophagaceae bacterium]|nr:DUF4872 domain-containing protein [Chitinophagaceae bacterium]